MLEKNRAWKQDHKINSAGGSLRTFFYLGLALWFSQSAYAHHGFSTEFDTNAPVVLTGKITKVELINPHAWIYILVETKGKPGELWMVEGGSPNTLFRAGVTKNTFKVGTVITAKGFRSINRSCKPACKANGRELTLPDGKSIFIKSPEDAAESPKK